MQWLDFQLVAEFYNSNLPNYKIKTCQTPQCNVAFWHNRNGKGFYEEV